MLDDVLTGVPVIGEGRCWRFYRDGNRFTLVRFFGNLDDEQSAQWRAVAEQTFRDDGYARVGVVAPTEGTATTSLSSRMKTAALLRATARNTPRVIIFSSAESTFVIRTILRTAGAPNVELVDVARAADVIRELRAAPP